MTTPRDHSTRHSSHSTLSHSPLPPLAPRCRASQFSVEFWIVPAALVTTGPAVIASIASSNDPTEIQLAVIQSDDSLIFRFNAGFCGTTTDPACELTVGAALSSVVAPTHVVFTFDGTDRYVYINDVASGPFSSPNSGETVWPSLESAYRLVLFNSVRRGV